MRAPEILFDPSILERLEELRWKTYLSLKEIILGPWHEVFSKVATLKNVYGFLENGEKHLIQSDDGFSYHTSNTEWISSKRDFIMCLEDEEILRPRYINSFTPEIQKAVQDRIAKETEKYPQDDDLIREFFKWETICKKRRERMAQINNILVEHLVRILNYEARQNPGGDITYNTTMVSLVLNGREYVYQGGKIIRFPDDDIRRYDINRYTDMLSTETAKR